MKLLFLIESMSSQSGGPAVEIARLSALLCKEEGISITVACLTSEYESLQLDKKIIFFQFRNPLFLRLSWFEAIRDLMTLINQHDIIFSTGIWGPIDGFALRIAWNKNKPIYIRVCGMLEPYILAKNPLKKWLGRFLYLNKNLKRAAGVIVNSNSEAAHVNSIGIPKEKIMIIPNGIKAIDILPDKNQWKSYFGINPERPVLLYLGRLHPKKGFHLLLEAIVSIPKKNRGFTILVAGEFCDDNYRRQIENMINGFELNDSIKFTGLVAGIEKDRHFYAADCFILPSESEGLPNAVLEAMAFGLPVIVTKGCNIPEIADYNAGLVLDLSVQNIVKSINWFTTLNESSQIFSTNAKRLINECFNPEECIKRYKSIIDNHRQLN